ncbi:MAG TPA: ABC transporter permease [Streptosporangiaceae bacterium]|nr:ABC transporter permease [Streptosporangiaceae bacterium]
MSNVPSSARQETLTESRRAGISTGKPAGRSPAARRRTRLLLYEPIPRTRYLLLAVCSLGAVFAIWSGLSYGGIVSNLFLPTPTQVWQAAVGEYQSGVLYSDTVASVLRILSGFVVSSALAIPVGVLMGSFKAAEAVIEPAIDFIRYMPAVAFIPLTLIWFGTTTSQKVVILFIGIFFQEVLLIMDNVKTVPRPLVDMAYSLGLSNWQVLRRVIFRSALPGIVDTLRMSMGWAWTYLVVAELVGANDGLGFRIEQAQRYLNTPEILLGIIVIGILGIIFDFGFKAVYAKSFPYMSERKS